METLHHDIVEQSLETFSKELAARIKDGWAISKTNPGDVVGLYGGTFTISLYRNAVTVEELRDKVNNVADAPRLTRAEILERARKAKAAKKAS